MPDKPPKPAHPTPGEFAEWLKEIEAVGRLKPKPTKPNWFDVSEDEELETSAEAPREPFHRNEPS
jgi:hypothetical protein